LIEYVATAMAATLHVERLEPKIGIKGAARNPTSCVNLSSGVRSLKHTAKSHRETTVDHT